MEQNNRVWIEFEPPTEGKGRPYDHALGHHRAKLATAMLARLCGPEDGPPPLIRWNESRLAYDHISGPMSVQGLPDHGQWFNLDYFGREPSEDTAPGGGAA
jgi:hypothetical protein